MDIPPRAPMRAPATPTVAATVAHRGASHDAPENTLAAIARAVEQGCDLVEVDVRRTRDGVLVLAHDAHLTRTTDITRSLPDRAGCRVSDLTYAEVLRLDAGSWFSPAYAGEPIPTLEQAIDLLRPSGTGMLLEVKSPAQQPGIVDDIGATLRWVPDFAAERLVVQSFDHDAMHRFAGLLPGTPVGLLGRPPARRLGRLATWASYVNPAHRRARASYVDAVHEAGMACLVWTVDRPADMARVLGLGVDGVITNRPDLLAATMTPGTTAPLQPAA